MEDCRLKNPGEVSQKLGGGGGMSGGSKSWGLKKSQAHTDLKRNVF